MTIHYLKCVWRRCSIGDEGGFTLVEMLVSSLAMTLVIGAIFGLLNPAYGAAHVQPEVADLQQRLRVGVETLSQALMMAGAGTSTGSSADALYYHLAPVLPYRSGAERADIPAGVAYRDDAISLISVPSRAASAAISAAVPRGATTLAIGEGAGCPPERVGQACGFADGMRAVLIDPSGAFDLITIARVQGQALSLRADDRLSHSYEKGAIIAEVITHTYYLASDAGAGTHQLMRYDGSRTDLPVVDNVVGLAFDYFGKPEPPRLLPTKLLTDTRGPWTTYGPKPPPLGVDNVQDAWPAGENCIFGVVDGAHVPRLPSLGGTSQIRLDPSLFQDRSPLCPDETSRERFDADLLRIRRIRVTLRMQVASASMRGSADVRVGRRPLFVNGGRATSAERYVPDYEIRFDVTPRNLNLGQ